MRPLRRDRTSDNILELPIMATIMTKMIRHESESQASTKMTW
jgi:hypothetical protein